MSINRNYTFVNKLVDFINLLKNVNKIWWIIDHISGSTLYIHDTLCVFVNYNRTQYNLKPVQKFRVKSINSNVNCLHKMKLILLICSISVIFTIIDGSISEDQSDDGNPGDALYLTKYIESGDIETVSFKLVPTMLATNSRELNEPAALIQFLN